MSARGPSATPFARNTLTAHPSDNETYSVDLTDRLPDDVTVTSATVTPDPTGPTIGDPAPNAAAFDNDDGIEVAIGKGLNFTMTGGTAGEEYALTIVCTCSDDAVRVVVCRLLVRDDGV